MINKILIRTSDRKTLHKDRRSLGMNGENLQEVLLFCLDEKIEGNGIVEVELPNGEKGMIEVESTEEGYELPVKSSLLTQTGFVKFQLRILHDNEEIFKSEIIPLEVKDSINATATIPEEYPSWVDTLTNLKKDLEKAESERVSNEEKRQSAEETRQENFTKMQETVSNAVSNIKDLTDKYNSNAEKETKKFNDNAVEQTKTFNDNSDSKLVEYNKKHTDKIKEYDDNSKAKLDAYNKNDTDKINAYNDNTVLKEKAYNDNAADKVKEYNTNVEQKETELEKLAEKKINEYNQVSAELTAKVKQVQAENESLKAENKLIKEQIPSATASGNNIHIEDSGSLDFEWKIRGGHKQKTREGYQLLNLQSGMQNGITYYVDDKGYFCISGTCTSDRITLNLNELVLNGTYTFTNKSISGEGINCALKDNTSEYKNIFFTNNKSETKEVNTVLKDLVCYLTNGVTYNSKIKLMLVSGSQEKDIELYGASPSPDYSSEIETVGSNVNILENKAISQTLNGVDFLVKEDKSIIVNGTSTDRINFVLSSNNKLEAGTYTLSGCPDGGSVTSYHLDVALIGTKTYLIDNGSSNTAKLDNDLDNLTYRILIEKGVSLNSVVFKPKLEKGSIATPYSPYGMGSVEIDVVNKNLLNIANTEETTKDGITYSIKNGILKLNGTTTSNLEIQLSKNIKIKKGKYTHSSSYIQSGLYISFDNLMYTMIRATVGKKITFELTEDTTFKRYFIWIDKGTFLNNVEIKLQLEVGDTATDFVEHQSQTAIMPIQQEMLSGDYIAGIEHHEWKKIVLTGDENWIKGYGDGAERENLGFRVELEELKQIDKTQNYVLYGALCNYLKESLFFTNDISKEVWGNLNTFALSMSAQYTLALNIGNINTVEELKNFLNSKYEAGTPVTIYYKLATPVNLELTEEQKAIRDTKLYTYKNVTNIAVSDELASIDVTYKKDLETEHNKLQNQINEIKQLLSTTETSAFLVNNLEKELESEVN